MHYAAYVIRNPKGILYKGSTENLSKRLDQHNSNDGFKSYTAKRGPWKLVYAEYFATRKEAETRERYFKSSRGREFLKNRIQAESI